MGGSIASRHAPVQFPGAVFALINPSKRASAVPLNVQ